MLEHPRFGNIVVTKSSGGKGELFGSASRNDTQIRLTISGAKVERHLSGEWIYPTNRIAVLELSPAQWVNMITAIGDGTGTPCTFDFRADVGYVADQPLPTSIAPAETYEAEVAEKAKEAMSLVADAEKNLIKLIADGKLTKGALNGVREKLSRALMQVQQGIPFVLSRFSEAVDDIANEKMVDVEARIALRLENIALRAIAENPILLTRVDGTQELLT